MTIVKKIKLVFQEGSSDKEYVVQIEDPGTGLYDVNAFYGRRGGTLKVAPLWHSLTAQQAELTFASVVNKKTAKGYKPEYSQGDAVMTSVKERTDTGMRPQLLNPIDLDSAVTYINDDRYCAQFKFDGERLLIAKSGDTITPANRKGIATTIPGELEAALGTIDGDFEIDGELVEGVYFVFDYLWKAGEAIASKPYTERYDALRALLEHAPQNVVLVDTFYTTEQKERAFANAKANRREGLVFKLLSAPFSAGRPNSGGSQLKCKFWESATCVVMGFRPDAKSVAVGLYASPATAMGLLTPVGNVTIKPNQTITPGQVVEVKYLYMKAAGGSLYQPELIGIRTDVDPAECTLDQIKLRG
jgi:bifunctional non-homologous end joining protein LigD